MLWVTVAILVVVGAIVGYVAYADYQDWLKYERGDRWFDELIESMKKRHAECAQIRAEALAETERQKAMAETKTAPARINGNTLAQAVVKAEGKKVEVNIAQVREVIRCTRVALRGYSDAQIVAWVRAGR